MDLKTLRLLVLENAGRYGNSLTPQRIDRLINRAVEHVTNLVEQVDGLYNIEATPITMSVSSGTEVYYLNGASASADPPTLFIRKILFAERTDQTWDGRPITCKIVDFRDRNRYGTGTYWPDRVGGGVVPIIYFARNAVGIWHMGFAYDPPDSMTIDVYYSPQIATLSAEDGVPREIPEQHHEIIAVRATKVLLDQLGGDSRAWDRNYAELVQTMTLDLSSWNRTGPWIREVGA